MSEEALQEILKAGMSAPVGSGAYDTLHLTVIQDRALIEEIGDAVNELVFKVLGKKMNKKFGEPTMILVSAKPGRMPGIGGFLWIWYIRGACKKSFHWY